MIFYYNKQDANIFDYLFLKGSTCFWRFLRPSSAAYNCTLSCGYCQPVLLQADIVGEMELTQSLLFLFLFLLLLLLLLLPPRILLLLLLLLEPSGPVQACNGVALRHIYVRYYMLHVDSGGSAI